MIDCNLGTYDFEDSWEVSQRGFPFLGPAPTIRDLSSEAAEERRMLLLKLGSCPTTSSPSISAESFAELLDELKSAKTMKEKSSVLMAWRDCFNDDLGEELDELAKALIEGDDDTARKLIARICA